MTKDTPFDQKWIPIKDLKKINEDPDIKNTYIFDRSKLDMGLFHEFDEQGAKL